MYHDQTVCYHFPTPLGWHRARVYDPIIDAPVVWHDDPMVLPFDPTFVIIEALTQLDDHFV